MVRPEQDDFESATENAALVEVLRRRIDAEGAISFHDFMEMVLYHPQLGYYVTREPMGREGDYLTSPEVNPIFGAMVGKQLLQFWQLMDRPERFDIVEQGAGSGRMARDLLRWAGKREPEFAQAIRYRIFEISPSLRTRQEATLAAGGAGDVEWLGPLPDEVIGCCLSTELVDSCPVHRAAHEDRQLPEPYVIWMSGGVGQL